MKAISLWEPWASLIRTGAKTWETRSWPTSYRGELLICAAKGGLSKADLLYYLCLWEFQGGLAPLVGKPLDLSGHSWPGVQIDNLNFGKAVAIVNLTDCWRTDDLHLAEIGTDNPFGDFSLGRCAWKLELIEPIEPFPVRGRQGFFCVPYSRNVSDAS